MKHARELIRAARAAGRGALDEQAAKRLLAAYGITVPRSVLIGGAGEADGALDGLKPPLAVKIVSPDILHKSDVGGVSLNLRTAAEVAAAIREMMQQPAITGARIDGFLVEEMAPSGQEVVIGGLRDADFGPLVMVGVGGIFVEIFADVSFRLCPIERIDAEEMLGELKAAALFNGARGRKPVATAPIIDALLKVGGDEGLLMRHADDIQEADINPLIVSSDGAVAVDARFILTQRP